MNAAHRSFLAGLFLVCLALPIIRVEADTSRLDATWLRHLEVRVEETAGLARMHEPVEVRLPAAGLSLKRWRREARVAESSTGTELPCQVLAASENSTVTVAFQVGLGANEKRNYRSRNNNRKY